MTPRLRTLAPATALVLAGVLIPAAGCAPGAPGGSAHGSAAPTGPVSTDVAKAGTVTLTEWDEQTDPGGEATMAALNASFQKRYPNVTIKRVSRSFDDLKTTLKLALSSNTPPDVVQANQGYPDMGAFVKAGLLQPEDRYAKAYGWTSRYPKQLLDLNRFSSDGKTWKTGNLYGISQTGELVGVFYNKKVLSSLGITPPRTVDELTADLAKAKAGGQQPMEFGNSDKSPGIHLLGLIQAATTGKQQIRDLVFNQNKASWTSAGTVKAAQTAQDWAKNGYLGTGFSGQTSEQARAAFAAGKGAFLLDGTWAQATVQAMGSNVGFAALAPKAGGTPLAQGGEGLAWAITSKTKHADVAAAYVDWLNNANGMATSASKGNLPAVAPPSYQPAPGVAADIYTSWQAVSTKDGLVPYLDYTTPTFYDTLTAGLQELLAGKQTPQQFTQGLQRDYTTFRQGR